MGGLCLAPGIVYDRGLNERPLPTNPNCVSFTTGAADLFAARTWAELQRFAADVSAPFHRVSGLPVLAGYAWRVALDRKNEQQLQGQLYFVFDGPATSDHLDALESAVLIADLGFGPATVERVPLTGALAVLTVEGRSYSVWSNDPIDATEDGEPALPPEPWSRQLVWSSAEEGPRVSARVVLASQATTADRALSLPGVVGTPAPFTEAEQEAERMRLAFARRVVEDLVSAVSPMNAAKRAFLEQLFPADLMMRLGLANRELVEEYYEHGREVLPAALGYHDKLALVGVFFSACCRDGTLDAREMRVLREGGEMLGLTREQVVKYLRRFW